MVSRKVKVEPPIQEEKKTSPRQSNCYAECLPAKGQIQHVLISQGFHAVENLITPKEKMLHRGLYGHFCPDDLRGQANARSQINGVDCVELLMPHPASGPAMGRLTFMGSCGLCSPSKAKRNLQQKEGETSQEGEDRLIRL